MPDKTQQNTANSQTTDRSDLEIETQAHGRAFIGLFLIVFDLTFCWLI